MIKHLIAAMLGLNCSFAGAAEPKKVSLQLRWDHQYQFAGYYAAQWQGYYAAEGLEVDIRPAILSDGGILNSVKEVAEGRADFGIGSGDILVGIDQQAPLKILAPVFQRSAVEFYAKEKTTFRTPADLLKLRVARNVGDLIDIELQAMLFAERIDSGKIKPYPHQSGIEHLAAGKVDVIPGYSFSAGYELAARGIKVKKLRPGSYGVDFYGDTLFSSSRLTDSEPDTAARFLRASLKGWEYALDHSAEIADRITRELPRTAAVVKGDLKSFNRAQIAMVEQLAMHPVVPLGTLNPHRWLQMCEFMRKAGVLQRDLTIGQIIFDPETQARAAKERLSRRVIAAASGLALGLLLSAAFILLLKRKVRLALGEANAKDAELRASEARLRKITDMTLGVVYEYRLYPDGRSCFPYSSDGMKDIYEVTPEQVREDASVVFGRIHPDDLKRVSDAISESARTLKDFNCELRMVLPRQGLRWRESLASPERLPDGSTLWHGTITDITERKLAEEALIHSQSLLKETEKVGKVGGWSFNIDTLKQVWTEEVYRIHELPIVPDPTVDAGINYYTPESRPVIAEAVRRAIDKGEDFDLELEIITAKGNRRAVHSIGRADLPGRRIYGFFQDITQRKQAEEALRKEREKLDAIFESSPVAMFLLDEKTNIVMLNRAAIHLTGGAPDAQHHRPGDALHCVHSSEDPRGCGYSKDCKICPARNGIESLLANGGAIHGAELELKLLRNGTPQQVWLSVGAEPLQIQGRRHVCVSMDDITPRKLAEQALRETNELFDMFMAHTPVYTFIKAVTPTESRVVQASENYLEMIGIPGSSMTGKTMAEMFPAELAAKFTADDWAVASGNKVLTVDEELNGRSYTTIKFPIRQHDKNLVAGFTIDTTERQRAEQALRRNENQLEETERMALVGGWSFNIDTMKLVWAKGVYLIHELDSKIELTVEAAIAYYTPESRPLIAEAVRLAIEKGEGFGLELEIITAKGNRRAVHAIGRADLPGRRVYGFFQDITERKRNETQISLQAEILKIFAADMPVRQIAEKAVKAIRDFSGYDAVGLRLTKDSDYPFIASIGYSEDFLKAENSLRNRSADGGLCRNADGTVSLECTCGLVISGKADSASPLFTPGGSAWTNNSLPFLEIPPEADPRLHPRNRCIHAGFLSIALIPIRSGNECLGLLHLADRKKDRLTPEVVRFYEGLSGSMAVAFSRKQVEAAMLESERRLAEAQRVASIGSYVLDIPTGRWTSSAELDRVLGIDGKSEHSFELWAGLLHPEDRAMMTEYFRDEVVGRRQAFNKEYRIIRKDDLAQRWVQGLGGLEFDAQGNPVKMVGTIQDINSRKLAELAKEKLTRDLQEKKQDMENFLYITTHDLRTPLITIQGFSSSLAQDIKELQQTLSAISLPEGTKAGVLNICGEKMPEEIGFVTQSARKMDTMITALLKVARLGRVQTSQEPVDMNEALKLILASMKFQLDGANAAVEVETLPPCKADAGLVGQMFTNLLDNAVKYRHPGRRLELKVSGEVKGEGTVVYTVTDNGLGIKAAEQEKVWDIFFRGSGAAGAIDGEGIGMPMVRRMVERSGGRIWLESEEGAGTKFFIELPKA